MDAYLYQTGSWISLTPLFPSLGIPSSIFCKYHKMQGQGHSFQWTTWTTPHFFIFPWIKLLNRECFFFYKCCQKNSCDGSIWVLVNWVSSLCEIHHGIYLWLILFSVYILYCSKKVKKRQLCILLLKWSCPIFCLRPILSNCTFFFF